MLTADNVRAAFQWCAAAAKSAGVDTTRWALREGSPTYGRAWKLVDRDPETGGERDLMHLGTSRRGAYDALFAAYRAFELAGDAREDAAKSLA